MKLSVYARKMGVRYETAWRWFKQGILRDRNCPQEPSSSSSGWARSGAKPTARVAIYARVSAAENRPDLERQAERLTAYCAAKGYQISQVVKEVGSGVDGRRPRFLKLLADTSVTIIVVEHKDRATRFGFRYIETLLAAQGRHMEVVNLAADGREDLLADLVAIVSSFCARLYGQRRAKRKTETLIKEGPKVEDPMQLVEQHRIDRHDPRWSALDAAAFASRISNDAPISRDKPTSKITP